ncbi:MAG: hypothetical protein Q9165_004076 [Trypethelium subeluteriae]
MLKAERDNLKWKTKALISTLGVTEANAEALSRANREMRSFIADAFYDVTRGFTADELIAEMRKHIIQSSVDADELISRLESTEVTLRRTSTRYSAALDENQALTKANHALELQRGATDELQAELENSLTGLEIQNGNLAAQIPDPLSTPARHLQEKRALEDRIKELEKEALARDRDFELLYAHRDSWRGVDAIQRERIALLERYIRGLGAEPPGWEVEFAPLVEQSVEQSVEEPADEGGGIGLGVPVRPQKWKGKGKVILGSEDEWP